MGLVHQVAWALLVLQSLVSRQKRWFGFVLYHVGGRHRAGLVRLAGVPVAETANAALAALSLWIILSLRATSTPLPERPTPDPVRPPREPARRATYSWAFDRAASGACSMGSALAP